MERGVHDRGGVPTDAKIDRSEHSLADWEVLTDAMVGALNSYARGPVQDFVRLEGLWS